MTPDYYENKMVTPSVLPLVDISMLTSDRLEDRQTVARELDRACADVGFLYIKGDQFDAALFDRLATRAKAYFALDEATKMASYIGLSENHSGYVPAGEEQFVGGTDDLKEAYDINLDYTAIDGRRPLLGPNLWPDMPGFCEDALAYYDHASGIGRQLFACFALALGLPEDHFEAVRKHPPSQLRMIHYPLDEHAEDRPGMGAHTDYECFTLLFATAPGLQIVNKRGQWMDVPLIEGTMIMNIGDMMEIMSNGRYIATRHRVKKVREERYSFPQFQACDYDHVVAPVVGDESSSKYSALKSGEHLFAQTAQTFGYLKRGVARGEILLNAPLTLDSFGLQVADQ